MANLPVRRCCKSQECLRFRPTGLAVRLVHLVQLDQGIDEPRNAYDNKKAEKIKQCHNYLRLRGQFFVTLSFINDCQTADNADNRRNA